MHEGKGREKRRETGRGDGWGGRENSKAASLPLTLVACVVAWLVAGFPLHRRTFKRRRRSAAYAADLTDDRSPPSPPLLSNDGIIFIWEWEGRAESGVISVGITPADRPNK